MPTSRRIHSIDVARGVAMILMAIDPWRLGLLYLVFALVVALLYFPSRWYWRRKATNAAPWMRFI